MKSLSSAPRWQRIILKAACLHCVLWGIFIMALPASSAEVYGFAETPHDLHLWQGTGLFIVLLGIGYGLASTDPRQHWGIVLIGLLAKVFGATGMCWSVFTGQVSSHVLWLLPFNDMIWFWPFWRIVHDGMSLHRSGGAERFDGSD